MRQKFPVSRAVLLAAVIGFTAGGFASAQTPPQPQPSPSPSPSASAAGLLFASDAGLVFNQIKADKTADFEMVMGRLKEALDKSDKPERKQQAAGWKVFKSLEPGPNGTVLYIFWMDPVVKDADYTVARILNEVFPSEVKELFEKMRDAYAGGQNRINLQQVIAFKPAG